MAARCLLAIVACRARAAVPGWGARAFHTGCEAGVGRPGRRMAERAAGWADGHRTAGRAARDRVARGATQRLHPVQIPAL